jgi:hypothetical protein
MSLGSGVRALSVGGSTYQARVLARRVQIAIDGVEEERWPECVAEAAEFLAQSLDVGEDDDAWVRMLEGLPRVMEEVAARHSVRPSTLSHK